MDGFWKKIRKQEILKLDAMSFSSPEMDGEVVGRKVIKYHNGVVMQREKVRCWYKKRTAE